MIVIDDMVIRYGDRSILGQVSDRPKVETRKITLSFLFRGGGGGRVASSLFSFADSSGGIKENTCNFFNSLICRIPRVHFLMHIDFA